MNTTKFIIKVLKSTDEYTDFRYYINSQYNELKWDANDATRFDTLPDARAYVNEHLDTLKNQGVTKTEIIKITETTVEQKNL